jgi:nitroreductase
MTLDLSQLGEWQHCQRNWDYSKTVTDEDVDNLVNIATQMPIKQNNDYFDLVVIRDRDTINQLVQLTSRSTYTPDDSDELDILTKHYPDPSTYPPGIESPEQLEEVWQYNPQVLAPLLIIFVKKPLKIAEIDYRSGYATLWGEDSPIFQKQIVQDMFTAMGIAAGAMIAYCRDRGMATAMCTCHNHQAVAQLLGMPEDHQSQLIFCTGYANPKLKYNVHPILDKLDFGTLERPHINVLYR